MCVIVLKFVTFVSWIDTHYQEVTLTANALPIYPGRKRCKRFSPTAVDKPLSPLTGRHAVDD